MEKKGAVAGKMASIFLLAVVIISFLPITQGYLVILLSVYIIAFVCLFIDADSGMEKANYLLCIVALIGIAIIIFVLPKI